MILIRYNGAKCFHPYQHLTLTVAAGAGAGATTAVVST